MSLSECLFGRAPFASKSVRELEDRIYDHTPVEVTVFFVHLFTHLFIYFIFVLYRSFLLLFVYALFYLLNSAV